MDQIVYLNIFQKAIKLNHYQRCGFQTWLIARGKSKASNGWITYDELLDELTVGVGICKRTAEKWILSAIDLEILKLYQSKKLITTKAEFKEACKKEIRINVLSMHKLTNLHGLLGNYASRFKESDYKISSSKFKSLCWAISIEVFLRKKHIRNKSKRYKSESTGEWIERRMPYNDHCYERSTLNQCAHSLASRLTDVSTSESSRLKRIAKESEFLSVRQLEDTRFSRFKTKQRRSYAMQFARKVGEDPTHVVWNHERKCWTIYSTSEYFSSREVFSYTPSKNLRKRCVYFCTGFEMLFNTIPMGVNDDYFSFCQPKPTSNRYLD